MATINYYPHQKKGETKIYFRLRLGRKGEFRQSTLLTIDDASKWDKDQQKARGKSANNKNLNVRLRELRTKLETAVDDIEKDENRSLNDINGKWLKELVQNFNNETPETDISFLTEFADQFTENLHKKTYKRNGVQFKYTQNTINKYSNFVKQLKDFEKHSKAKYKVSDVDESFTYEFLEYLSDKKGLSVNTKGRYVKRLKTILKEAEVKGIKVDPKYNLIKGFEGENIVTYLTFEELEKVIAKKMPSTKMDISRDWFIIASYTAQRISDLFRFTDKNIKVIDGGRYLVFKQFKTGQYVEIPIHYHVENILQKYNGKFPPKLSDNEQSNRTLLSSLIKDVCEEAGINEPVRGRLNGVIDIYPKYKLISNHTGRRSFASNFYNLPEWSNAMIMNITGHVNERNFYKYIDKEDRTLSRNARSLFDSMKAAAESSKFKNPEMRVIKKASNN